MEYKFIDMKMKIIVSENKLKEGYLKNYNLVNLVFDKRIDLEEIYLEIFELTAKILDIKNGEKSVVRLKNKYLINIYTTFPAEKFIEQFIEKLDEKLDEFCRRV